MNHLVISGYAGKDATERRTANHVIWSFSVGVSGRNGKTDWFNVSVFTKTDKHANYIAGIKKGTPITVSGPVALYQYERNGVKYSGLQVTGNDVFYSTKGMHASPDTSDQPQQMYTANANDQVAQAPSQSSLEPADEGYDPFAE